MPMPLHVVGPAIACSVKFDAVAMAAIKARPPLEAGDGSTHVFEFDRVLDGDRVAMAHASHDKPPADQPHDRQQHRSNDREAENAAKHDLTGADRLGGDGLDRLGLDVGRQAKDGKHERHHADQQIGGREDEAEIELARVDTLGIEKPSRKQHDEQKQGQCDEHIAPQRLLDRKPRQRPDPSGRHARQVGQAR